MPTYRSKCGTCLWVCPKCVVGAAPPRCDERQEEFSKNSVPADLLPPAALLLRCAVLCSPWGRYPKHVHASSAVGAGDGGGPVCAASPAKVPLRLGGGIHGEKKFSYASSRRHVPVAALALPVAFDGGRYRFQNHQKRMSPNVTPIWDRLPTERVEGAAGHAPTTQWGRLGPFAMLLY